MASHVSIPPPLAKRPPNLLNIVKRPLRPLLARFARRLYEKLQYIAENDLPKFANEPKNLRIELPRRISNPSHMRFGDNVNIGPGSLLVAQTFYPTPIMQNPDNPMPMQSFEPRVIIGNRVTATGSLTIDAMQRVEIGDDVMFASNVIVMDGLHGFHTANEPYKYQPMWRIAPVRIGHGCWIAQNVVIMPGVTIGEFSIIGANSIVTQDIPARCIAFGNPARVMKRWCKDRQCWMAADSHNERGAEE